MMKDIYIYTDMSTEHTILMFLGFVMKFFFYIHNYTCTFSIEVYTTDHLKITAYVGIYQNLIVC